LSEQPTILLAENNDDDIILAQRAFDHAGFPYLLMTVRDGEDAISYLSGFARFSDRARFPMPDLFLLDLRLPLRDGFEVLCWRQTQPQLKQLPVIVLTQSNRISDANEAYRLGAFSFLVKGTDFKDTATFAQSVSEYLARAKNNAGWHLPPATWPLEENMSPNTGTPTYPHPPQPTELPIT
jgi:CheY-like chemotaxis protein